MRTVSPERVSAPFRLYTGFIGGRIPDFLRKSDCIYNPAVRTVWPACNSDRNPVEHAISESRADVGSSSTPDRAVRPPSGRIYPIENSRPGSRDLCREKGRVRPTGKPCSRRYGESASRNCFPMFGPPFPRCWSYVASFSGIYFVKNKYSKKSADPGLTITKGRFCLYVIIYAKNRALYAQLGCYLMITCLKAFC